MKTFLYAVHAPFQAVTLMVPAKATQSGEAVATSDHATADQAKPKFERLHVICKPGRNIELPEDHKVTRALEAAGYLLPPKGDEPAASPAVVVPLGDLPENDSRRVEAIVAIVPQLVEDDFTSSGTPKVSMVELLAGFKPTSSEIRAAVAAIDLSKGA